MKIKVFLTVILLLFLSFQIIAQHSHEDDALVIVSDEMTAFAEPGLPISLHLHDKDDVVQVDGLGLWVSGVEAVGNGFYHRNMAKSTYTRYFGTYVSGPQNDELGTSAELQEAWNRFFPISRHEVELHIADFENDAVISSVVADNVMYYPAKGNPFFKDHYGFELPDRPLELLAPFVDRNNNGIYEPHLGDFPKIKGTKAWFSISNARDRSWYGPTGFSLEFYSLMYLDEAGSCRTAFSYDTKIYYTGDIEIQDFRVGLWMANSTHRSLDCREREYIGFLPSEGLSFFYGDENLLCDNSENIPAPRQMLYQKVEGQTFDYASQVRDCFYPQEEPDFVFETFSKMRGKFGDGFVQTWGNEGYNIGSTDTVKIMFNHDDNPEHGPWYDSEVEVQCTLFSTYYRSKHSLTSFGPFVLNKGSIIDVEATAYFFEADDWLTPKKERIIEQYNNIRVGCTDSLEWNVVSAETDDVLLFPNPATDDIYVILAEDATVELDVFTSDGQLVLSLGQVQLSNELPYKIDVSSLLPGKYYLRIVNQVGELEVGQFMVL